MATFQVAFCVNWLPVVVPVVPVESVLPVEPVVPVVPLLLLAPELPVLVEGVESPPPPPQAASSTASAPAVRTSLPDCLIDLFKMSPRRGMVGARPRPARMARRRRRHPDR